MSTDKKRIAIITSGHSPFDDRIFWRFATTLKENDYQTQIFTSVQNLEIEYRGINIYSFDGNEMSKSEKISKFIFLLTTYRPEIIISCEPLTILAASKYRHSVKYRIKIIADITEYYPHYNMLEQYSGIKKILKYCNYFLFNVFTIQLADELIIGENNKAKLYKWTSPFKKKTIIGYFPPKKFFAFRKLELTEPITLCYSGEISEERGISRYFSILKNIAQRNPDLNFKALIIGNFAQGILLENYVTILTALPNVSVEHIDLVNYAELGDKLSKAQFLLDLREKNTLFNRSIPIRIFDYMACGRPIIFSNLNSLKGLFINNTGLLLVDPENTSEVVDFIEKYLNDLDLYIRDSVAIRRVFEKYYNWELIEDRFLRIMN